MTGGAVRVGRAICLALARAGAAVGFTYRSSATEAQDTLAELRTLGAPAAAVACDQRRPEDVRRAADTVEEALGEVTILVNSAAVFRRTPLLDATLDDWDEHLETNLRGPWLFCRLLGLRMKERGGGVIVNLSDVAAARPFPSYLPYSISKAGLDAMTRGLAVALGPEVRVNGIAPGEVLWPAGFPEERKQAMRATSPLRRDGSPEDVAAAVLFLVGGSEYVTGVVLPVDGGRLLV